MRRWVLGAALLAAAGWGALQWHEAAAHGRGQALFEGRAALAGRLPGHDAALPAVATRCANCHAGSAPLGGVLSHARLAVQQPRRGGPPSTYDAARLCDLLRTGIDPARVIIATTMPRYDITEPQCSDLWTYLTAR